MSAHSSVSFRFKDAAVFIQQLYIVFQSQMLQILWELVKEKRLISRAFPSFLFQSLIHKIGHKELSFSCMEEMASSKLIVLVNKAISVIAAAFVS